MFKANEGSTRNLMQMCVAYFLCYVITGLTVKYFLGNPALGLPGMKGLQFLAYSTLGASPFVTLYVLIRRWYKIESAHRINFLGMKLPIELLYIIPSGICTGIVIPTTTLMYTLPISVMVAMVIMRGSVIVISRLVDYIQIKQGILHKKVYKEDRQVLMKRLEENGIQTRPVWRLNHEQKPYKDCQHYKIENAKKLVENSICLPSSSNLTNENLNKIVSQLNG